MAVRDFGRVADIYDATRAIPEAEMGLLVKAMRGRIPGRGPLIDVGVGTGRFASPLQALGVEVVGIDVSRGMMAKAVEKGLPRLLYADVRRIPFRDDSFEAALLVHVLHLVDDWPLVVRESARVARRSVLSVVETKEGTDLRDEYLEMRRQLGYPLVRFEDGERGLMQRVAPRELVLVAEAKGVTVADDEIRHLRERGQSLTWDTPEEIHQRIIEKLTSSHAGKSYPTRGRIELATWSAEALRSADLGRWARVRPERS